MEKHKDLTYQIIGCCYEVYNQLGNGFLEKVYAEALALELNDKPIHFIKEAPISVFYKNECLNTNYFADFLVESEVILELKTVDKLNNSHYAQCLNYLNATGMEVCLLINFGGDSLEVRRVVK